MSKRKTSSSVHYEQKRIREKHQRQNARLGAETEVFLCKSGPDWYRKYAAHVLEARTYLVIYVAGFLVIFLLGITVLVGFRSSKWTEGTTQPMEVAFDHYVDDGTFCLYSATDSAPFYIYCNSMQTKQKLITGCSGAVPYKIRTVKHGNPVRYYDVAEITDMNGDYIISLEESNQSQAQENRHFRTVFGAINAGLLLIWTCFVIVSIAVGCAPERYPCLLVRLLYRRGSLVYFNQDGATVQ